MDYFVVPILLILCFNMVSFLFVTFAFDFEKIVEKIVEKKEKK